MRVLLHGANGRMGQAVRAVAREFEEMEVIALPRQDRGEPSVADAGGEVIVDFSLPDGVLRAVQWAERLQLPLLTGTTGLAEPHQAALDRLAQQVAVLQASNFSLGLAALRRAVSELALCLDWDCEVLDAHHRGKRDAPSGTALSLAAAICDARERDFGWQDRRAEAVAGGRRERGSIGIASLRGGSVVGDHTVHFLGDGERLECTHRADDRAIFARGALHAVRRLVRRAPGRYQLEDVLWS